MLTHRGFSAWIESDGQPLPEYLVAVDETSHRVSCWIPGVEGQTFTVFWKDHGGRVDSCGFIYLDGLPVPGRFLFGDGIASRSGVRASRDTERPFTFQKIPELSSQRPEQSKDAGIISLKIKRVVRLLASKPANLLQPIPNTTVLGKRKAGDLCIGFGDEVQAFTQHVTTWATRPFDQAKPGTNKPSTFVSFVFRYRSPDFLEAQGISPEEQKPGVRSLVFPPPIPIPAQLTPLKRRVASLPPPRVEEPTTIERPSKRPRLMPVPSASYPPPSSKGPRLPPPELRRAVSCSLSRLTKAESQSPLLLPQGSFNFEPPPFPDSSATSDSPETFSHDENYENAPNDL